MILTYLIERFLLGTAIWFLFSLKRCQGMSMDEAIAGAWENPMDFMFDESSGIVMLEMDMLYDLKEYEMMKALNESTINMPGKRQAIQDGAGGRRWPDGVIPYEVDTNVFKGKDRDVLDKAMDDWMRFTCLRFVPATSSNNNRIKFVNGDGCASYVGMQNKKQDVLLAKGCRHKGTVIHELGHALGLHHEQTRPDRDEYVKIHFDNIADHVEYNFRKYSWSIIEDVGVQYDYSSIMHYGATYFAEDKSKYTIETLDKSAQDVIGNRKGLSFRDIKTVNLMYNCRPKNCRLRDSDCPGEGFVGKDCSCWCPSNAPTNQDPYVKCTSSSSGNSHHGGSNSGNNGGGFNSGQGGQSCSDMNRRCPQWAAAGQCYKSTFVKTLCEKSCRACGQQNQTPQCRDFNQHCNYWASVGHCTDGFQSYMRDTCKQSCRLCSGGNYYNPNYDSQLGGNYGSGGYPAGGGNYPTGGGNYPAGGGNYPAGGGNAVGGCVDADNNCRIWAVRGYCSAPANFKYMEVHCRRSCNKCSNYDVPYYQG